MATIRKREGKNGVSYDVQIRLRECEPINKSFKKYIDAKSWGIKTEMEMRARRNGDIDESRNKTLADAIERYRKYVLPGVAKSKREHIVDWWEQTAGKLPLSHISTSYVAGMRDKLMHGEVDGKERSAATVVKYLVTLSHILSKCANEWEWLQVNPVLKVSKPSLPKGRTRYLDDLEREKFICQIQKSKNPYLYIIVILDLSTGMRRTELSSLTWPSIDFERERIVLKDTKNGEVRILPLVSVAKKLLQDLYVIRNLESTYLFPGKDPNRPIDFRSAWRVAVKRAGLEDFKFHDLRHSFASYCVMNGSSLNDVGDLLGHKSNITKRYCHLSDAYRKDVVVSMNEKIFGNQAI